MKAIGSDSTPAPIALLSSVATEALALVTAAGGGGMLLVRPTGIVRGRQAVRQGRRAARLLDLLIAVQELLDVRSSARELVRKLCTMIEPATSQVQMVSS